ncbi:MAG: radical SAM family heme chaperone HemW, partial [Deltaproteobacteria bacterium]|nr:radical SAM family heme chaperone HemW [Deltaproteobacteria bacterium]
MFTLYLHIPYCIVKCGYCDFHSLATKRDEIPHQAYAQAILAQLKMQVELHQLSGQKIGAIFFGGGTPSLMEPTFFEQVLVEIQKTFSFANDLEVTSEMNPATAKLDWLKAVRAIGINRLSIGIQSFNPKYLKFLDRDHTASDVHSVMNDARTAGFENMSCDLIYSIPGQTTEEVASDVNTALSFAPQHVSAYQLTFEPGTPLTKRYQHASPLGLPPKISDDASLEQFQCVTAMFEAAGLHRYEISNYARPDFESRHNLNY